MHSIEDGSVDDWCLFAKGGANVLLQYVGEDETFKGKLLRVRLKKRPDLFIETAKVFEHMSSFEEKLSSSLIQASIVQMETKFASEAAARYNIAQESQALLIENILHRKVFSIKLSRSSFIHVLATSPGSSNVRLVIETKPKWLVKSNTLYCRNCALAQIRAESRHFCPLDWIEDSNVNRGVSDFLQPMDASDKSVLEKLGIPLQRVLVDYFKRADSVLKNLCQLQMFYNTSHLASTQTACEVSDQLLKAFSLRDVGIFLRVCDAENSSDQTVWPEDLSKRYTIEPVIFDLDPKARSRLSYWKSTAKEISSISNKLQAGWVPCGQRNSEN